MNFMHLNGLQDGFVYAPPAVGTERIIHEDASMLVIDKPSGLLSVPGRLERHKDSLSSRVQRLFPEALIVHRLDMATSGLLVVARGIEAQRALSAQFQSKTVSKQYVAIVEGHMTDTSGEVDLPLICDWPNRPKQIVDYENGKPSKTEWERLALSESMGVLVTRVGLKPITGRTHQLRVHLAALGHGILGDTFYATEKGKAASDRLLLHAESLSLDHPSTGERLSFRAPCPF